MINHYLIYDLEEWTGGILSREIHSSCGMEVYMSQMKL